MPWQCHVLDILCCHPLTPTHRHAVVTPSPIPSVKGGDDLLSSGNQSQTDCRGCQLGLRDTNQVMSSEFPTSHSRDVGPGVGAGGYWGHCCHLNSEGHINQCLKARRTIQGASIAGSLSIGPTTYVPVLWHKQSICWASSSVCRIKASLLGAPQIWHKVPVSLPSLEQK